MRTRLDLDLATLDRFTMLIHGNYGVGKTSFLGDMLRTESKHGAVGFINIAGEDGYLSIQGYGLGECGETVDTLADFKAALGDLKQKGCVAIGIDGGKQFGDLIKKSIRPDGLLQMGQGKDDWQRFHREFETTIASLRLAAPVIVMASASDRSLDQISGETSLTPDMPGRQAAGVGGQFDFVFIMRAQATSPTTVRRWLATAPQANTVIRSRLPRALPHEIEIPKDGGGWSKLRTEMEKALKGGK